MEKEKLIEKPKKSEVAEVKPVVKKPVVKKPVEEIKVKGFKNNSEKGIKIKLIDGKKFDWITVKPGEIVTIPKKIAKANGLTKVE